MTTAELVDCSLEPLTSVLTPEVAQRLVDSQPAPEVTARMEELGRKANEGTISAEEEQEYKTLIDYGDMIALLKLKAKRFLRNGM
jgi:hypothetical protein